MQEFVCAYCGVTVLVKYSRDRRTYCSRACRNKAVRSKPRVHVDLNYDWVKSGNKERSPWVCRYNDGAVCMDRDCRHCGFNPAVAERRIREIRKKLEGSYGTERIPEEETGTGTAGI